MWQDPEQPMQAKWETIANTATMHPCADEHHNKFKFLCCKQAQQFIVSHSSCFDPLSGLMGIYMANILPVCTASILTWWSTMFVLFRPMLKYELISPPKHLKESFMNCSSRPPVWFFTRFYTYEEESSCGLRGPLESVKLISYLLLYLSFAGFAFSFPGCEHMHVCV